MKFVDYAIVFGEVPDEITLAINISNCPCHCKGCHSPELWEDKGTKLTHEVLSNLIEHNSGISCVSFMGGDADLPAIKDLILYLKSNYDLKVAWYSGRPIVPEFFRSLDYLKLGAYNELVGPLNCRTTNQRMYKVEDGQLIDITSRFWK